MNAKHWFFIPVVIILLLSFAFGQQQKPLPLVPEKPFPFVAVGDTGCGCKAQADVAIQMLKFHDKKPFDVVLMLGDNIYGKGWSKAGGHRDLFDDRFDRYYQPLRERGVKFYAVLGNHDLETRDGKDEVADKVRFNILGKEGYYVFTPDVKINNVPLISFFAINSDVLTEGEDDKGQIPWLSKALSESKALWKVPFFHHPIYTPPGRHNEEYDLRNGIENILSAAGVKVTFTGHNHFYARMKPQNGVTHFVSGGGGRDLSAPLKDVRTAASAKNYHFMYMEVYSDRMDFWAIPPSGEPFDQGTILRTEANPVTRSSSTPGM